MSGESKVAFPAILKSVGIKRMASEDREARIVFDFRPAQDVMEGLVKLSQQEDEVWVVVLDKIPQ